MAQEPQDHRGPGESPVAPRHWPALDGIRGLGVVAIFFYHWASRYPLGGWLSVDLFFVLSGFLITTLLLGEWDKHGRIAFKAFYARRALRLFPVLALNIVVCVALVLIPGPVDIMRTATLNALPFVVFYCVNWFRAFSLDGANAGLFVQTWSLALEEQFYLLWPALFVVVVRRTSRRALVGCAILGLALVEALYRRALVHHGANLSRIYNSTDTHSDGLLLGVGLAFLLASEMRNQRWVAAIERLLLAPVTVAATLLLAFLLVNADYLVLRHQVIGIPLANICTGVIVWNLVTRPLRPLAAFLGSRPLRWLGKRSYGLYLWQWPVIFGSDFYPVTTIGGQVVRDVLRVVLTFGLEALCYRYWEQPFLRRKRRYQGTEAMPQMTVSAGNTG